MESDEEESDWSSAWDTGLESTSATAELPNSSLPPVKPRCENNNYFNSSKNQDVLKETSTRLAGTSETAVQNKSVIGVASSTSNSTPAVMSRMGLNDNKAGMQGLDRDKINQIIYEASKGSKYYANEMKKEEQVQKRIDEQTSKLSRLGPELIKLGTDAADYLLSELESQRDLSRVIVHIDMDMFYAAVEMRDQPSLRHKPMAVGGNAMLSTSNYVARRYGVRAAMPGFIGKKLCPDLVIVPSNFDKYKAVSKVVRDILLQYDVNMCPMSLDEAYFDITEHLIKRVQLTDDQRTFTRVISDHELCTCAGNRGTGAESKLEKDNAPKLESVEKGTNSNETNSEGGGNENENLAKTESDSTKKTVDSAKANFAHLLDVKSCTSCEKPLAVSTETRTFGLTADDTVEEIRFRIQQETTLTASAGIAPNMMLAKVCSDRNKPNGQYKIPSTKEAVLAFIGDLAIRKIGGIGKVSEKMLQALKITTCTDLYNNRGILYHLYSNISFNYFMRVCIGIGSTRVERDGERKSISIERTFAEISKPAELYKKCHELCEGLAEDVKEEQLVGKTVTLKLKLSNFEQRTRAHTIANHTADSKIIYAAAREILRGEILSAQPQPLRLRLMGVRLSNLLHESDLGDQKQETIKSIFSKIKTSASAGQSQMTSAAVTSASGFSTQSKNISIRAPSQTEATTSSSLQKPDKNSEGDTKALVDLGACSYANLLSVTACKFADLSTVPVAKQGPSPMATEICTQDTERVNDCNHRISSTLGTMPDMAKCPGKKPSTDFALASSMIPPENCTMELSDQTSHNSATTKIPGLCLSKAHAMDDTSSGGKAEQANMFGMVSFLVQDECMIQKDSIYIDAIKLGAVRHRRIREQLVDSSSSKCGVSAVNDREIKPIKEESHFGSSQFVQDHTGPEIKEKEGLRNHDDKIVTHSTASISNLSSCTQMEHISLTSEGKKSAGNMNTCQPDVGDEKIDTIPDSQIYECPVCYHSKAYEDLKAFSLHMDECLARKCVEDDKSNVKSSKKIQQSIPLPSMETSAPEQTLPSMKTTSFQSSPLPSSKHTLSTKKDVKLQNSPGGGNKGPTPEEPTQILICPICNAPQRRSDLSLFNQHVDMCLNRQAIRDVIQTPERQANTSGKRSQLSKSGNKANPSKRPKVEAQPSRASPSRSISNFFKPH